MKGNCLSVLDLLPIKEYFVTFLVCLVSSEILIYCETSLCFISNKKPALSKYKHKLYFRRRVDIKILGRKKKTLFEFEETFHAQSSDTLCFCLNIFLLFSTSFILDLMSTKSSVDLETSSS